MIELFFVIMCIFHVLRVHPCPMLIHSLLTEFPRYLSIRLGIVENTDDSYDCGDTLNTNERKFLYYRKNSLSKEVKCQKAFQMRVG